jgi:hypothetical protein
MRKAAIVGVVLATVSVLALVGGADFAPVAGPLRLGQDGSVNDFPNQVALVKDAAGNSHILFYSDDQRSLTYAMVGPDGSTKIATTTIYPQITTQSGPVEAAVTGAGKVFVVFNQAGRNQGDGDTRYMILDPASQPQNGAAANNQAPFVAVSDTVISKADGIHSHRPQVAADPAGNLHVVWWDGFCCPTSPSEPTDASSLHYRKFGPNGENLIDDRTLLTPSAQPYLGQPIDIDVDQRGNVHVGFEGAVVPPVRYQTLSNPDRFVIEWITGQDSPFDSMWPAHSQLVLYPDGHFVVNQIDARAVDEQLPGFTRGFIGPNQGSGGHSTRAEPVTETAKSFSFVTDGIGGDYLSAEIPATAETLDNPVAPIRLAAGVRNTRRAETVALPFAFTFYGTSYNNVNLTNKGYVRFDPTSDSQVNDSPPVYPSSSASNTNIIDALRYANMASGFQANGYLMVDGATGNLLIGPSTFPRTDYLMRWPRLEVDAFGQVNHVWQQKGASPDVITDSVSASEIWHERFDPYRMPLDGTPITDWNVVRTVAPHPLTVGDGGLSHHPVVASEPSGKIFVTYNRDVADDTDYHNNAADDDVMLLALDPRSGAVTDGPTLVSAKNGDDFHNRTGIAGSQGSARVDLAWPDSTQTAPSSSGTDGIVYEAFTTAELPNNPPVPTISASPPTGSFPRSVTLALGAADPDGDFIASYRVSFGDGTPDLVGSGSPPATVVHTYQGPGPYTVTLTVTDGRGLSGSASALVSGPGAPGGGPAKEFI